MYLYYSTKSIDDQRDNHDENNDNDTYNHGENSDNEDCPDGKNTITQSPTDIELDSTIHDISDKGNNNNF